MTFTVTYRGADGALRTEAVETASRGDCLAQMKARGVSVQSVMTSAGKRASHGGGAKMEPSAGTGRNRHVVAWFFSVACVLLAGGIGWYWLNGRHGGEATIQADGPKKPSTFAKEVKPAAAPKAVDALKMPVPNENAGLLATDDTSNIAVPSTTNSNTNVESSGKKRFRIVRHANARKKSIFKEKSDQRISRLLSVEPGGFLVGTFSYKGFKEQFLKSLKTPIIISDEDSPKDAALKQAVLETRAELKAKLDSGEDIEQVMEDVEKELRRLSNYRIELVKQINRDRREGKFTAYEMKDYVEAANQLLKENGIKPLAHPEIYYRNMKVLEKSDGNKDVN